LRFGFATLGLAAVLAGTAWPQSAALAQRRPPTFGAGLEVIRLSLSVLDAQNRYVAGLAEGNFAVFEDGVRQPLSYFRKDPLPLSVALLLDCSASMAEKLPVAQEAGAGFVRTLGPEDQGEVVQFNTHVAVLQDFTQDRRALETAIRSTHADGSTVLYNAIYVTLRQLELQGSAELPRRRAIVVLSDGEDTASIATDDQVLELARQAEIGVYAIGLRPDRTLERQSMAFSRAMHFLTALARDTGGESYFPGALSELDAVYGRVADELRSQYTLGYVSNNPRRDGKWRRIVVRTPGRDDLQVRHKVGYYAPRG
jgi:Ca-activated chloride channel family protein